jgi:hypothetical protein
MVANTNESCSDTQAMRPRAGIIRQRQARYRNVTDIDGRTRSGRRARELARQFEAAIGGDLTDNQRLAIGRAATLTAIAEDRRMRALAGEPVLLDDLVRVERLAMQATRNLGLDKRREPAEPSLAQVLAELAAKPAEDGATE